MLTLYVKTGCPFCNKTLPIFNSLLKLEKEVKNIGDPGVAQELIEKGGKQQVPYLIDTKTSESMYESDDIIAYLKKEYNAHELGEGDPKAPNAGASEEGEKSGGVCSIE
ncbi:MAG: glutathione S-transferase N-terminal domain-containing protein [Candidatus Paceibacterota bacterium]